MSEDTRSPELQVLAETLIRAWQQRSAPERDGFARTLGVPSEALAAPQSAEPTAPTADPEPAEAWLHTDDEGPRALPSSSEPYPSSVRDAVWEAVAPASAEPMDWTEEQVREASEALERRATVSGAVRPADLAAGYSAALANLLLDRLAPGFDRTRVAGSWSWTLKSERRAAVLRALGRDGIAEAVAEADSLPTDAPGRLLRLLLTDQELPLGSPRAVRALACSWAVAVQPERVEQVAELRRDAARHSALSAFDHLLKDGFVGRAAEIARLRGFVSEEDAGSQIPILTVSGIGGLGKSTLLAQALRPLLAEAFESPTAPLLISIDFDRRSFLTGGELELSFELSRQLELFFPETSAALGALRGSIGRARAARGETLKDESSEGLESVSRHGDEFAYEARSIIRNNGVNRRRMIVVLDTFEEWQRGTYRDWDPQAPAGRVLSWLSGVREAWDFRFGVIVSGRTPIPPESYLTAPGAIHLKELGRRDSVELLLRLGLRPEAARQLARLVGGSPLSLKLAARYVLQLPAGTQATFMSDFDGGLQGVNAALRQGLLYKRFLDHIADPLARKLAHPGLALRRVTPELIRKVLAEPCGLGPLEAWEAQDLFTLLAQEVWLVERRGEELLHYPEVRSAMLRAMREDPQQADRVRAVHAAAARWYKERPEPDDEDRGEAVYHCLSLIDPREFEAATANVPPEILRKVAQSAEDLPDEIRVRLLHRVGRRLSVAEAKLLPEGERQDWAAVRCDGLVRSGQPERAIKLWMDLGGGSRPGPWYAIAIFQAELWDEPALVREIITDSPNLSLRYNYLLSLVLDEHAPDEAHRLRGGLDILMRDQLIARKFGVEQTIECIYFYVIIERDYRHPRNIIDKILDSFDRYSFDATRYLRASAVLDRDVMARVQVTARKVLAGSFRPTSDFLEFVERRLAEAGVDGRATRQFRDDFAQEIEKRMRSAEVLGGWSDRFAQAVETDMGKLLREPHAIASLLQGLASDDPEWRVPLRNALEVAARTPVFEDWAAEQIAKVLGAWLPIDLRPDEFLKECRRSRRKAWMSAVEYIDRCGELPRFMSMCMNSNHPRINRSGHAYLKWIRLRDDYYRSVRSK
ncbi:hypothetical protein MBUL_03190 [Methylobacterium bullatum]|uniref:Uncharacterized protein n=1 Tax=Methylobacterium bullatum TaxID=570505 RepID=A0A679JHM7_9HYPH|nr:hypothetical protein MBUL_03190 [Methylobacterium bullatum]